MAQPIVILGGFLSSPVIYREMRDTLASLSGQPVWICPIYSYQWFWNITRSGWARLLRQVERTVRQGARLSATGKVTLVGHSAGGLLARLYLQPEPFLKPVVPGLQHTDRIITLGSPHNTRSGSPHNRWGMGTWLQQHFPGAYHAPRVRYASVAGKLVRGDLHGSSAQRRAYRFYRQLCGKGGDWGDGVIPIPSALLEEAYPIILDGVGHHGVFGGAWYGTPEAVRQWWRAAEDECGGTA